MEFLIRFFPKFHNLNHQTCIIISFSFNSHGFVHILINMYKKSYHWYLDGLRVYNIHFKSHLNPWTVFNKSSCWFVMNNNWVLFLLSICFFKFSRIFCSELKQNQNNKTIKKNRFAKLIDEWKKKINFDFNIYLKVP